MNIYQRIILIVGAIVFVIVLMTSPRICIMQSSIMKPEKAISTLAPIVDVRTAAIRGFAVLGATVLLFFAVKSKKKN